MAKKQTPMTPMEELAEEVKTNKAAAIRSLLDSGITSPKDIQARLKEQNIEVSTAQVSTTKTAWTKTQTGGVVTTQKKAAAKPRKNATGNALAVEDLRSLKELASRAGGFEALREYVEALQ
jgi:hypothetical protein